MCSISGFRIQFIVHAPPRRLSVSICPQASQRNGARIILRWVSLRHHEKCLPPHSSAFSCSASSSSSSFSSSSSKYSKKTDRGRRREGGRGGFETLSTLALWHLTASLIRASLFLFRNWGRTGFDFVNTPEAACRGWFVGLVKNRAKK